MKTMKVVGVCLLMVLLWSPQAKGQGVFNVYHDEVAFREAIGIVQQADDLIDLESGAIACRLVRGCHQYGFCCRSYSRLLWNSPGALAAGFPMDTLYVSNANRVIHYVGGYFYNVDSDGRFVNSPVTLKVAGFSFTFQPESSSTFTGFVFCQPVEEVSFTGNVLNLKDDVVLTMTHVYMGSQENMALTRR